MPSAREPDRGEISLKQGADQRADVLHAESNLVRPVAAFGHLALDLGDGRPAQLKGPEDPPLPAPLETEGAHRLRHSPGVGDPNRGIPNDHLRQPGFPNSRRRRADTCLHPFPDILGVPSPLLELAQKHDWTVECQGIDLDGPAEKQQRHSTKSHLHLVGGEHDVVAQGHPSAHVAQRGTAAPSEGKGPRANVHAKLFAYPREDSFTQPVAAQDQGAAHGGHCREHCQHDCNADDPAQHEPSVISRTFLRIRCPRGGSGHRRRITPACVPRARSCRRCAGRS